MIKFSSPLILLCSSLALPVLATEEGENLNFQSCPIFQDTSSVPCWLSEYEGELYYLGIQTDVSAEFQPPYLGHQVIVEGRIAPNQPRICGGIVLEPVVISPVAELDANCNTMLPARADYTIDFNPRPPGPSGGRLAFQGPRPSQVQAPAIDPADGREFTLHYYHDGRVEGRNSGVLNGIARYAFEIDANDIQVTGYSGSVLLSNGTLLEERPELGRLRAEELKELLVGVGIAPDAIHIDWEPAVTGEGSEDWRNRRTLVEVRRRD